MAKHEVFQAYLAGMPAAYLNKHNRRPYKPAGGVLVIYYSPKVTEEFRKFLGKPPLGGS